MKKIALVLLAMSLAHCTPTGSDYIDMSIRNYESIKNNIKLGDKIQDVLPKLYQAMKPLPLTANKQPDQYIKKGVKVEIHYARTGRQPDWLTTDDEFTPYVFNNGVLVAIGWKTIGGVKSIGKVVPHTTNNIVVPSPPPPIIIY